MVPSTPLFYGCELLGGPPEKACHWAPRCERRVPNTFRSQICPEEGVWPGNNSLEPFLSCRQGFQQIFIEHCVVGPPGGTEAHASPVRGSVVSLTLRTLILSALRSVGGGL